MILASLVLSLVAVGWIGFMLLGMSAGDAAEATINILSTCGLGGAPFQTGAGSVLIVFLQAGSIAIVAVAIASLSQVMLLGTIRKYMGRFRMDDRINKLSNHSIIAGYSLTGMSLAQDLIAEDQTFVVVERDPEKILKLEEKGLLYVEGDATEEDVLRKAGIERARALFAVLSHDSDNLMVVLSARGLNDKLTIVSRSTREDYLQRFIRAGANAAMSPQEWASRRMIQAVLRPHLLKLLSSLLDPTVAHAYLDEVNVPQTSPMVGKTLAESGIRKASGIVILGIARKSGDVVSSPGPETPIQAEDVLIGYGQRANFASLANYVRTGST